MAVVALEIILSCCIQHKNYGTIALQAVMLNSTCTLWGNRVASGFVDFNLTTCNIIVPQEVQNTCCEVSSDANFLHLFVMFSGSL